MLLFSALVAGSFSLGHVIANDISPAALTAMRFFLAVFVMGIWVWRSGQMSRDDLRASWRYFLLGGLMGIYFVLMFEGLKTAPAVSTAAVFTLTPVISGVFAFFILGQIVTRRVAAALLMGALGAVWVIFFRLMATCCHFNASARCAPTQRASAHLGGSGRVIFFQLMATRVHFYFQI